MNLDDDSLHTSVYMNSSDEEEMLSKEKLKHKAKFAGVDPETGEMEEEEGKEGESSFDKMKRERRNMTKRRLSKQISMAHDPNSVRKNFDYKAR